MKLSLGFSTCPNDTFIFDAMVNGKIDTYGIEFELIMTDVEELNHLVINHKIDISKVSFNTFGYVLDKYKLLNSGSALGFGCGPLLISKNILSDFDTNYHYSIGIPGKYTTANFLFSLFYPKHQKKTSMIFHEIESQLIYNDLDAGVIIHENRFTYAQKGLNKIVDLGELWERNTNFPIPLGGIAIKNNVEPNLQLLIDKILRNSVEFAFKNSQDTLSFVSKFAQEMDPNVMKKHIDLYVNNFSIDLGDEGKSAIRYFLEKGIELGLYQNNLDDIFV